MRADWTASGACTSGSTAPPRGATRRASGGAATTSTAMTGARTAATKMTGQPTQKEETMNAKRIEGAVALVTGANRGIGRALTEALLTRGVRKVYATARNAEAPRTLLDQRLVSMRHDVTDMYQIRAA